MKTIVTVKEQGKLIEIVQIEAEKYFFHVGTERNILISFSEMKELLNSTFIRTKAKCGAIVQTISSDLIQIDCIKVSKSKIKKLMKKYGN